MYNRKYLTKITATTIENKQFVLYEYLYIANSNDYTEEIKITDKFYSKTVNIEPAEIIEEGNRLPCLERFDCVSLFTGNLTNNMAHVLKIANATKESIKQILFESENFITGYVSEETHQIINKDTI